MGAVPVVIAAAELAMSVSQLFSSQGEGIADLLHLQTEMLQTISRQVVLIEKGIEQILENLGELQKLIGQLPAEVVRELYARRLNALLGTYLELMKTYSGELAIHGITSAQNLVIKELELELLQPIRDVRSVLFTFSSEVTIPSLCAALQVEAQGMIMANYPNTRLLPALGRYREWLTARMTSLQASIASERKSREAIKATALAIREEDSCCTRKEVARKNEVSAHYYWVGDIRVGARHLSIEADKAISDKEDIRKLISKGDIDLSDLPAEITVVLDRDERVVLAYNLDPGNPYPSSSRQDLIPISMDQDGINKLINIVTNARLCDQSPLWSSFNTVPSISESLFSSGLKMITFASFIAAARQAIGAIDGFAKNLSAEKP